MAKGGRMVIDAQRGKKPAKHEVAKPMEQERPPLNVHQLNRAQREALAAHLANVDAIDVAYTEHRRTGRDVRDAKKANDQVWLSAAMQDGNRADDAWQEAKATAQTSREALDDDFNDVEFGRKSVREQLRAELAESQEEFEAREASHVEQTQQANRENEMRFIHEVLRASQNISLAQEHIRDAGLTAVGSIGSIQETLRDIRVIGIDDVRKGVDDWNNHLEFARAGVEDANATVLDALKGGEIEFSHLLAILPVLTDTLREAQTRLTVADKKAQLIVPRLISVDTNLIGDYAGNHDGVLSHTATYAKEVVERAQLQLREAIDAWDALRERGPETASVEEVPQELAQETTPEPEPPTPSPEPLQREVVPTVESSADETVFEETRVAMRAVSSALDQLGDYAPRRSFGETAEEIREDLRDVLSLNADMLEGDAVQEALARITETTERTHRWRNNVRQAYGKDYDVINAVVNALEELKAKLDTQSRATKNVAA